MTPNLIWWCEEHQGHGVPRLGHDPDFCWKGLELRHLRMEDCRMVERRLVSPTALVIERDENGEWPEPVRQHFSNELFAAWFRGISGANQYTNEQEQEVITMFFDALAMPDLLEYLAGSEDTR